MKSSLPTPAELSLFEEANIPQPWFHLIAGSKPLVFLMENSRLFEVSPDLFAALAIGDEEAIAELREAVPSAHDAVQAWHADAEPSSISLNLAQSCNLACSYCYADEGRFGGQQRLMPIEVAIATIERLIEQAPKRRVTIGFIGGEPFLNRDTLYRSVEYATELAARRGISVGFSITTNGTLLNQSDITLLRENAFAVSVSIDGGATMHDLHRTDHRGTGSFGTVVRNLRPLLDDPGRARIAARSTVTRSDLRVLERVEALCAIGFQEIGVSPLRTSPDPTLAFTPDDWSIFLKEMIRIAEAEWQHLLKRGYFRFSNLAIALKEIHRGSCRPLPCGSAANYVSVSAEGNYFTCHRTIDDSRFALGTLTEGPNQAEREKFLQARLVDTQEPCRSCWARYLCGGGCHAEVIASGRDGCDYIRGWLDYCLRYYDRALSERPDIFSSPHNELP
ncbi:MAG: SPASM domain-containing protein [Stigonema ocellatum SAG 48.90 = DSM 106950]|nr:SPASM domain-containing protein [Stigonema ocellatum SAG 48.90 = DSM 106950]